MQNEIVFKKAIQVFGELSQSLKTLEELAEFQVEWTKQIQGIGNRTRLLGEMADLQIMLNQVICMVGEKDFEKTYTWKIDALIDKLEKVSTKQTPPFETI